MEVLFLMFIIVSVSGQTWVSRARVQDHTEFFTKLMQETIHEVERREWCNLKLDDVSDTFNLSLYNWQVSGDVTYTNGFVVSIQKLDISNMEQDTSSWTVDGVLTPIATVRGQLNMHDVKVGFDVLANLTGEEPQRYSGEYTHTSIVLLLTIQKNLLTNEINATTSLNTLSAALHRMIYLPANNVTEVLSRRYTPSWNWNSVANWGRNIFNPIMVDIVNNKIPFPNICFSC